METGRKVKLDIKKLQLMIGKKFQSKKTRRKVIESEFIIKLVKVFKFYQFSPKNSDEKLVESDYL